MKILNAHKFSEYVLDGEGLLKLPLKKAEKGKRVGRGKKPLLICSAAAARL